MLSVNVSGASTPNPLHTISKEIGRGGGGKMFLRLNALLLFITEKYKDKSSALEILNLILKS